MFSASKKTNLTRYCLEFGKEVSHLQSPREREKGKEREEKGRQRGREGGVGEGRQGRGTREGETATVSRLGHLLCFLHALACPAHPTPAQPPCTVTP